MADLADKAQEVEALNLKIALSNHKPLSPTGYCLNCSEALPLSKAFCDQDCENDHILRTKNRLGTR